MIRVLVAEDHTIVREGIKQLIGLAKDMQVVGEAGNGEAHALRTPGTGARFAAQRGVAALRQLRLHAR